MSECPPEEECPLCEGTGKVPERQKKWRNRRRVRQRQAYIVELADDNPGITLKEIALRAFERFGNPETGKPMNHSTVIHHLRTAGMPPGTLIRRRGASATPDIR